MRANIDEYFLKIAKVVATRSTCVRRQVGCILVDKNTYILATGYNGSPRGMSHCIDVPCPGADCAPGTGLNQCKAIHAEGNALMQCSDINKIVTAYVTVSPCMHCVKMLMNTSAERLIFSEVYPGWEDVRDYWVESGREWELL